ncbi:MAG: phage holin family protein [Opitutaceae bacterium]|jgi:putative membrane protein|nr:phage holin family protein [Opitutaceae bacterium]
MNGEAPFSQLALRWTSLALGVTLATRVVPGLECRDGVTLVAVVLALVFLNAVLRPLLVLFALPFVVLTLGLGLVVINALLLMLAGALVRGFYVESFWSALGGAAVAGLTNAVTGAMARALSGGGRRRGGGGDDGVIDV